MAVVQGLKWLDEVYGRDRRDGILSCCAHQIFFAANDLETASYVSQSCGEKTVKTISTSKKGAFKYEPPNVSTSPRARPLISKEKVKQLSTNEEIIITEASFPVKANKIRYFKDKSFAQRLFPAPEVPQLKVVGNAIPVFKIAKSEPSKAPIQSQPQEDLFHPDPPKPAPRLDDWLNELQEALES
jgi:type IV secretion system protein VirD4